jgi:hypothetical protein
MSEEQHIFSNREDFVESWLTESPQGLGNFETYDAVEYHINDLLNNGLKPQSLGNNIKKIELNRTVYYWIQDDKGTILLGVHLEKKPQALVVMVTGKHPSIRGRPPYASDFYKFIIDDNKNQSLRLMSDESLSDEGKAIWDQLFNMGLSISVYDKENPGKSFTTFNTADEMNTYFKHDDTNFKRYQYVVSAPGKILAEARSYFHIRRFREQIKGML